MTTTFHNPGFHPAVGAALSTPLKGTLGYTLEYARFSTTLYQCRPDIPFSSHGGIYRLACAYQALAVAEERCAWRLGQLQGTPLPERILRQPGIIATYHTGSYRLLPRWLHSQGLPFSMVVSRTVLKQQGGHYRALANHPGTDRFDLIDAERPDALLTMRRALRSGKYLLVYVDGNTGALPKSNRNTVIVPFFDARIRVRTGIAHLAYLAGAPLYPIAHLARGGQRTRFWIGETVYPDPSVPRVAQATAMMRSLYSALERVVRHNPQQWEGWFYLYQNLHAGANRAGRSSPIRHPAWITVEAGKQAYRLDRKTGVCYPITGPA